MGRHARRACCHPESPIRKIGLVPSVSRENYRSEMAKPSAEPVGRADRIRVQARTADAGAALMVRMPSSDPME
jgi:hypothetical protein